LGSKRGSLGTSPAICRGGGATDATRSGGGSDLISDESEFLHKRNPKKTQGMDATMNCEVPDTFYWAEEGGDSDVEEKGLTTSEVLQCFCFGKKRGRGSACFGRGKKHIYGSLGSRVEGRPKDAAMWRRASVTGGRSQTVSRLI
jgi:hypothetical protein